MSRHFQISPVKGTKTWIVYKVKITNHFKYSFILFGWAIDQEFYAIFIQNEHRILNLDRALFKKNDVYNLINQWPRIKK